MTLGIGMLDAEPTAPTHYHAAAPSALQAVTITRHIIVLLLPAAGVCQPTVLVLKKQRGAHQCLQFASAGTY